MRHLVNYSFHVTRGRMAHLQQTTVTGQKGKEFGLRLLLKKIINTSAHLEEATIMTSYHKIGKEFGYGYHQQNIADA